MWKERFFVQIQSWSLVICTVNQRRWSIPIFSNFSHSGHRNDILKFCVLWMYWKQHENENVKFVFLIVLSLNKISTKYFYCQLNHQIFNNKPNEKIFSNRFQLFEDLLNIVLWRIIRRMEELFLSILKLRLNHSLVLRQKWLNNVTSMSSIYALRTIISIH